MSCAALAACSVLTGDLGRIIAIEVDGPAARQAEEGDTLQLTGRAIDASGDTVPDALITWQLLSIDAEQVPFTLDTSTGLVNALVPGSGSVRARVESLTSDSIAITITGAPDSMAADGDTRVTLRAAESISPQLAVVVHDLTTVPGSSLALPDKLVQFHLVEPPAGAPGAAGLFLTRTDSVPGADPGRLDVATDASGRAWAVVRKAGGTTLPDSAVVDAEIRTARGGSVTGSPVRFVIVVEQTPP